MKSVEKFAYFLIKKCMFLSCKIDIHRFLKQDIVSIADIGTCLAISDIIKILTMKKEDWSSSNEVFVDYDFLSELMLEAKLSIKDQSNIIDYLVSKNLISGITESGVTYFDIEDLRSFDFDNITSEQAKTAFDNGDYKKITQKKELTDYEKLLLEDLSNFIEQKSKDYDEITEIYRVIEKEYIKNKENLTEENVLCYITQLKKLKLLDEVAIPLEAFLMKKVKKERTTIHLKPVEAFKEETVLSKKQYYELTLKLKKFLDLDTMKFKKEISNAEMTELFNIMIQLKYNKEIMYKVAREYEKMNQQKNTIVLYLEMADQLKDYVDEETIHNLEEIFKETFICSREDYIEWKNILKENLTEQMPKDYTLKLMK